MTVLSHDKSRLALAGKTRFSIHQDSGYFFTNVPAAISHPGHWAFDPEKKRLYFYPAADLENIEASRRAYGFQTDSSAVAHEISGFSIQNTNTAGIFLKNSAGTHITDNLISNAFAYGIQAVGSDDLQISRNQIRHANSYGVSVDRDSARAQITENTIYATGAENYGDDLLVGRGIAIFTYSKGALISNNLIDRSGYDGIYLGSDVSGVDVSYNHIRNVMLSLADGGAIYTGRYYSPPVVDRIHHNIIENAYGYKGGFRSQCFEKSIEICRGGAHGIYLDEQSSQRVVDNNTVINATSGLFLHWGGDNQINSNLFFDNKTSQVLLKHRDRTAFRLQNNTLSNNILFSRERDQKTLTVATDTSRFSFSRSNDNYFLSPYSFKHISVRRAGRPSSLSLSDWQSLTGYDKDSHDAPANHPSILDYANARVLFNASQAPADITLGSVSYCDLQGNKRGASARLGPFEATLLLPCNP